MLTLLLTAEPPCTQQVSGAPRQHVEPSGARRQQWMKSRTTMQLELGRSLGAEATAHWAGP